MSIRWILRDKSVRKYQEKRRKRTGKSAGRDKASSAGQVDTKTRTQPRATPLIRERRRRRRRDRGQKLLIKLSPLG